MRGLGRLGGQGLVVEFAGGVGIERQRELVVPAKLESRLRQCVITLLCAGMSLGQIGGVRGDLVGDHAVLDVLAIRQAEVLLGRDVAQHRGAGLRDDRRADRRGDVVVGRGDVGGQRAQRVEGSLLAELLFQAHVLDDLVHRDVAGSLDHHLHAMGFGDLGQLTQRAQLGELGLVVGVGDRSRPQPVAQRERHVVAGQDLAQLLEIRVEKRLAVMREHQAAMIEPPLLTIPVTRLTVSGM